MQNNLICSTIAKLIVKESVENQKAKTLQKQKKCNMYLMVGFFSKIRTLPPKLSYT